MFAGGTLAGCADWAGGSRGEDRRGAGSGRRVESVLAEEWLEVLDDLLLVDGEVVVEEEEELLLHQVDFLLREHLRVSAPVLVLWRRVVEVFCRDDEGREEDAVTRAGEAFRDLGQAVSEPLEVDEGR